MPFAHDQPDNAVRLRRLSVGDFLLPRRYQARAVIQNLKRLIESASCGENCRRRASDLTGAKPLDSACVHIEGASGGRIMYDL